MVEAPIFHVNGDDVEAVVRVCRLAVDFRQRFGRDVLVDLVRYLPISPCISLHLPKSP